MKYEHSREELELIKELTIEQNCNDDSVHVFVHSAATSSGKYFERRQATRDTWAHKAVLNDMKVIFVLAQPRDDSTQTQIITESERFGDILQFNFIDDYHNLTLKAVALLRWIALKCTTSAYIVKTDDDIIVNVERLRQNIDKRIFLSGITGKMFVKSKPVRDISDQYGHKWLVPKYIYDKDYYPPYISGAAYVVSSDVIPQLYWSAVNYTGPVLYIDDLYLTGIIAKQFNISIHDSPEFFLSSSDNEFCGIDVCTLHTISTFHGCNSVNQTRNLWDLWSNTSLQYCRDKLKSELQSGAISFIISITVFSCLAIIVTFVVCKSSLNYRQINWQRVKDYNPAIKL